MCSFRPGTATCSAGSVEERPNRPNPSFRDKTPAARPVASAASASWGETDTMSARLTSVPLAMVATGEND
jgi:hypothetical protein